MTRQKGSILILTLWILILLVILSISLSRRAASDVKLARHESRSLKATYLARAGVMKMLAEIARDANSYDSLNEAWRRGEGDPKKLTLRDDTVFYGASDEDSRLNLNSNTLQEAQFTRLGMDGYIARKILDYRNKKGVEGFEFIEELFLVEDMTREVFSLIRDSVTIHRGADARVNINTASEKVLDAVLGDWGLVQDVLEYRRGPDGNQGTEDDDIFRDASDISMIAGLDPALFSVQSSCFRIWAKSFFSEDKESFRGIEAVIDRTGKIYHWKEY